MAALALLLCAFVATPDRADFSLIVTNNRSLTTGRPDLRFADDDGVQYAKLFAERMGRQRVMLLTRFDTESARLHPGWVKETQPPTLDNVRARVAELAEMLRAARAEGLQTAVTLLLAGHGDVEKGQGFIELEGGRLTAAMLDQEVIAKLPADRVHLIIDSCNSYFMLSPRKAGGMRSRATVESRVDLVTRYPHVGALLSTSAEALTYEWSELQSGIFSYLVRSALRGGADADANGSLSYREVAAFVDTATRDIVNELYRPRVLALGPQGNLNDELAPLNAVTANTVLELTQGASARLTVRDAQGVRVLDVHSDGDRPMALVLPDDDGPYEVLEHAVPPVLRQLNGGARVRLEQTARMSADTIARGEAPVFSALFKSPFGGTAIADFDARQKAAPPPVFGISRRDVERLTLHLNTHVGFAKELRVRTGIALVFSSGSMFTVASSLLGVIALYEPRWDVARVGLVAGFAGGAVGLTIAGAVQLARPSEAETVATDLVNLPVETDEQRAEAVVQIEAKLLSLVERERASRIRYAWVSMGSGIAAVSAGALSLALSLARQEPASILTVTNAAASAFVGIGAIVSGWFILKASQTASERLWALYTQDDPVGERLPTTSLRVAPSLIPVLGGATLGVSGVY